MKPWKVQKTPNRNGSHVVSVMNNNKSLFLLIIFLFQSHFAFANDELKTSAYLSENEIKKWASETVGDTLSFSHKNYREILKKQALQYTVKGWESFGAALRKSRTLELVEQKKRTLKSFQYDPALVCHAEENETSYNWYISVPIRSILYNEAEKFITEKNVLVHVNEVKKEDDNSAQILIEEWVATENHLESTCNLYKNIKDQKK